MQAIFSSPVRRAATQPQQYRSAAYRNIAAQASIDAIEWEELPSLANSMAKAMEKRRQTELNTASPGSARAFTPSTFGNAWSVTQHSDFNDLPEPQAFREPLRGMAVREVHEPEVFSHFFGAP